MGIYSCLYVCVCVRIHIYIISYICTHQYKCVRMLCAMGVHFLQLYHFSLILICTAMKRIICNNCMCICTYIYIRCTYMVQTIFLLDSQFYEMDESMKNKTCKWNRERNTNQRRWHSLGTDFVCLRMPFSSPFPLLLLWKHLL